MGIGTVGGGGGGGMEAGVVAPVLVVAAVAVKGVGERGESVFRIGELSGIEGTGEAACM